ncbi:hypothetical protein DSLASN_16790 [Desulfoluna limicola]|uniref:Uncharacterized protein n=1 Tax=Desulfoluna limicola TaxID=2810562 RepID=A0ABM7PEK5_9BACT|nr:hypothetical protein [Desulfoluna limicola]BCS96047.1 hypothetical protein DSLASN_16790 [Desulfoluna limicola]
MDKPKNDGNWIYLFVNNPGSNESFAGFVDDELDIRFIPAFYDKESALMCSGRFMDRNTPYEVQAIHKDDLDRYAAEHRFLIFMLDKTGAILEKMAPKNAS